MKDRFFFTPSGGFQQADAEPKIAVQDFFQLLLELKDYAISMIGLSGAILSWNLGAAYLYGYAPAEAIGSGLQLLYTPGEMEAGRHHLDFDKALKNGRLEYNGWQLNKDGSSFYASVIITPLRGEGGDLRGFVRIAKDMTVQKAKEEENRVFQQKLEERVRQRTRELEVVNKELEAFSYSVSHDLRAPLRAIIGFSRILQEDYGQLLDAEGERYLNNVIRNAGLMGQLIDDLLKFSRMSRLELVSQAVNGKAIVEEVVRELLPVHPGKAYRFTISDLPACRGDGSMLRQVWFNLVDNALKYASKTEEPCISIGGKQENGYKLYYITDNGVGFDMQYAGKLFGVFQRLHGNDEFEGTGLGLALVKRIVHKHNGDVWAEAALGKGATFYFTIPDSEKNEYSN